MTKIVATRPLLFAGASLSPGEAVVGADGRLPEGRTLGLLLRRGYARLDGDEDTQRAVDGGYLPRRNEGSATVPQPEPTSSNNEQPASVRPAARRTRRGED